MDTTRIVLITGATRGIGRAITQRFAREGCRLALVHRTDGAAACEVRERLADAQVEVEIIRADLGDLRVCRTVIDRVVAPSKEKILLGVPSAAPEDVYRKAEK